MTSETIIAADATAVVADETVADETIVVVDLFCGAGGSSTGAEQAITETGRRMELRAINHWAVAIRTHQLNHPKARHYIQDLEQADPETIVPEGYVDILLASPECRFYSRARGGKPTQDQGRMNPWIVQKWITALNVRCLILENVPEFIEWGPLQDDGKPDRTRKGLYFQEWVRSIWRLGYEAEWRTLNAADYGDATTRTRFFLMARNDGKPIRWPEPTHSKTGGATMLGTLPKWRGAKEIIDWSNQGRSLLDDPKYIKKPLSPKTRQRIAKGLAKFGGPLAPLYIRLLDLPDPAGAGASAPRTGPGRNEAFILNRHGENGSDRVHPVTDPLPTVTTRGAGYKVDAGMAPWEDEPSPFHGSDRQHTVPRDAEEPVHTVTTLTGGGLYVVQPVARPFVGANRNNCVPKDTSEPVPSATTAHGGGSYLVQAEITPFMLGQQSGAAPRDAGEPVPTIAADGAVSLVRPTIIHYYGQSDAQDIAQPVSTILSNRKHALANPTLIQYFGQSDSSDVERPVPAITTKARYAVARPTLLEVNHAAGRAGDEHRVHSTDDPLRAITTKRHTALAEPVLLRTGRDGDHPDGKYTASTDHPLPNLGTRNDLALANPDIKPLYEHAGDEPAGDEHAGGPDPAGLGQNGTDPRRLVYIDGEPWLLDIRFRMLQNDELARAMGFEDEETKYEFVGNVTQVTKQIGNAVPVGLAAALVGAALSSDGEPGVQEETQE